MLNSRLTEDQIIQLAEYLEGTCNSVWLGLLNIGAEHIDIGIAEDQLLDGPIPIEQCASCNYWSESALMILLDDMIAPICDDCLPKGEDEGLL